MGDVAGVQQEVGLAGQRVDLVDGQLEGAGDVLIGGLVEADVAVADLDEAELRCAFRHRLLAARRSEELRGGHASGNGPYQAGSGPGHAAEKVATVDAVDDGLCFVAVGAAFKFF